MFRQQLPGVVSKTILFETYIFGYELILLKGESENYEVYEDAWIGK
jgi:hypothetical protein